MWEWLSYTIYVLLNNAFTVLSSLHSIHRWGEKSYKLCETCKYCTCSVLFKMKGKVWKK